jgi:hypothetical protein
LIWGKFNWQIFVAIQLKHKSSTEEKKKKRVMVTCSVDFNNKELEISFFVFKPTVVIVEHLIHGLKHFSSCAENLGCIQSSIFKSIHGNMVLCFSSFSNFPNLISICVFYWILFLFFLEFMCEVVLINTYKCDKSYCFKFSYLFWHMVLKKNCIDILDHMVWSMAETIKCWKG